jgi:GTP-binding protein YchF
MKLSACGYQTATRLTKTTTLQARSYTAASRSGLSLSPACSATTSGAALSRPGLFLGQSTLLTTSRRSILGGSRGFRATVITAGLKTGIVGLPNVGKSTMFNAICENGKAQAANFPFCTIEPNVGIVAVPDPRLEQLRALANSLKTVPTSVEFVDIAGLVKGASKGEGLGNQFLANIRECDSIVQVVRCFENDDVIHVSGKVDPLDDTDVINFELALADVSQIEKRMERLKKGRAIKPGSDEAKKIEMEQAALTKILAALDTGKPARSVQLTEEEAEVVRGLYLLTAKPMVYAANVSEEDLAGGAEGNKYVAALRGKAEEEGSDVVVVSAQVEAELNELDPEEAAEYLSDLGVEEGGLKSLIRATYKQLGLLTYFTTGVQETRAWTIKEGMTAPQAAGVIHSDFEKGFIRAETVAFDDYVNSGGFGPAKEKGLLRLEGKEYVVSEGDIMTFRSAPV